MKKIALIILTAVILPVSVFSQTKRFGLGIVVGEPTGFTAKYWLSPVNSLNGAVAWSVFDDNSFEALYLHIDHVFYYYDLFRVQTGKAPVFIGVGGRFYFPKHDDTKIGFRIPMGLAYMFDQVPIEIYGEIAPVINIVPETDVDLDGGVGFRYFF
ncbi:hypothetical protein JXA84_02320 [candidate division WOR-3 bacterium]|nr:hypothetical protein [candidate division WOR-3 bacterium]